MINMKKAIPLLLSVLCTNAFAVCDSEKSERDEFRTLCLSIAGASTAIATYGSTLPITVFGIPIGGLLGVPPGIVAHNQCRIWMEKEQNLANCERNYAAEQEAALQRQRNELAKIQARNNRIAEINSHYDELEAAARQTHQTSVRSLAQRYMQQGRNLRDPLVQADLRQEMQRMEAELTANFQRLGEERRREIRQI
jgi:hypothetical protein